MRAVVHNDSQSDRLRALRRQGVNERALDLFHQLRVTGNRAMHEEVVERTNEAAAQIDLDEAATRRLIDEQLRAAGWEADSEALRHAAGARPQKGKNLAIAEWPTKSGPADYVLFTGTRALGVVEAKKRRRDVSAALAQSKRYSGGVCSEGRGGGRRGAVLPRRAGRAASKWYDKRAAGLGEDLVHCVDHAPQRIAEAPHEFSVWRDDRPYRRPTVRAHEPPVVGLMRIEAERQPPPTLWTAAGGRPRAWWPRLRP